MGSAQTSIEALVGPPIKTIPFLAYPDGTYNPDNTITSGADKPGTAADINNAGEISSLAGYRGAIMQVAISSPVGSNANAIVVIPHHGPSAAFSSHEPFGVGWGFYINGADHASPGSSQVRSVFIDMDRAMPFLSAEVTVNTGSFGLIGVAIIPVIPKYSPKTSDYVEEDFLAAYGTDNTHLL